jgi:hypothetical protein
MWPTPLFLALPAALLAAELGLTVDAADADVPEGLVDAPVAAAVEAAPDAAEPLISAWIVELKVPVMPLRLFKPLAAKARIRREYDTRELGRKCLDVGVTRGLVGIFQVNRRKPDEAGKGVWSSLRKENNTTLTKSRSLVQQWHQVSKISGQPWKRQRCQSIAIESMNH